MSEMPVELDKARPNIRIEIQNEKMEVDESEEGEIVDEDSDAATNENIGKVFASKRSVFTTGINIFDEREQKKRQERAKRFALKPEEIHNFTEADVEELYESLGISNESDPNIRYDAVHLQGIAGLTAENILDYFAKYAPTSIEWIDGDSCNVLWMDNVTAARAIYYTSKAVRGMPAREQVNTFAKEFMDDDTPEENTGQSILLKNRQVELKIDDAVQSSKINLKNSVDISEIAIPIPPGYWRLGGKCSKTDCLLMRFALRTDKKPYRAETLAKYFKKLTNTKGIIDEGKKKEIRGIFERNKDLNDKNPWGSLARNWDHDAKFREQVPNHLDEPQVEVKNPSLLVRLGKKKVDPEPEEKEDEVAEESPEESPPRIKAIPRMRMYADEEEEKVRRKKLLQTIKKQSDKLSREEARPRDLRNILSITNYLEPVEVIDLVLEEDLGKKLRNRSKQMVYSVEHATNRMEPQERKENLRSADIRAVIEERRARSPEHRKREYPRLPIERRRSRSPLRRHAFPMGRRRSSTSRERRRSQYGEQRFSHRTLHSDRMSVRDRRRNSNYSDDEASNIKPRSKVAVVIKTQQKPTVASTIWSRVQRRGGGGRGAAASDDSDSSSGSASDSDQSDSESEDRSASDSSSSESESESGSESESSSRSSDVKRPKKIDRPGFRSDAGREGVDRRNASLKITMPNDRYNRR